VKAFREFPFCFAVCCGIAGLLVGFLLTRTGVLSVEVDSDEQVLVSIYLDRGEGFSESLRWNRVASGGTGQRLRFEIPSTGWTRLRLDPTESRGAIDVKVPRWRAPNFREPKKLLFEDSILKNAESVQINSSLRIIPTAVASSSDPMLIWERGSSSGYFIVYLLRLGAFMGGVLLGAVLAQLWNKLLARNAVLEGSKEKEVHL